MRNLLAALLAGAVILCGTVAGLLVVEAGLRLHEYLYPSGGKGFFWVPSKEYGWGLGAGKAAPFYNDQKEFHTYVRINSRGLRDIEHDYDKPSSVFRILILGDSYMEALQVEQDEMFARLLEAQLNARADLKIEVVNTGVSAWGTDNELLFFRSEGYKYRPDLVLLSFTTANDIRENYFMFNRMALGANLTKPHFTLDAHGKLKQNPPVIAPSEPLPWWRELRLGQFLFKRLGGVQAMPGWQQGVGIPPPADPKIPYVPPDMLVYKPDTPLEVKEALRVTKALLLALRDEVEGRGSKFAVMIHNGPWVYDENRWKFMCARNPKALVSWDKQKPNREIGAFLGEHAISHFDLYETFLAERDTGEPLFFGFDPHWRPRGHRVAARVAAEFLTSRGLAPSSAARLAH